MDTIQLTSENGEEMTFKILATFDVDGDDFCIATPIEEEDEDSVVIFRIEETDEDYLFEGVDEDDLIDRVLDAYYDLVEKRS